MRKHHPFLLRTPHRLRPRRSHSSKGHICRHSLGRSDHHIQSTRCRRSNRQRIRHNPASRCRRFAQAGTDRFRIHHIGCKTLRSWCSHCNFPRLRFRLHNWNMRRPKRRYNSMGRDCTRIWCRQYCYIPEWILLHNIHPDKHHSRSGTCCSFRRPHRHKYHRHSRGQSV